MGSADEVAALANTFARVWMGIRNEDAIVARVTEGGGLLPTSTIGYDAQRREYFRVMTSAAPAPGHWVESLFVDSIRVKTDISKTLDNHRAKYRSGKWVDGRVGFLLVDRGAIDSQPLCIRTAYFAISNIEVNKANKLLLAVDALLDDPSIPARAYAIIRSTQQQGLKHSNCSAYRARLLESFAMIMGVKLHFASATVIKNYS